ncbi:TPA: tyrosine-type recombinase/integrase [Streptococcus suis]
MATVEPIRSREDAELLIQYMYEESAEKEELRIRNAMIVLIGLNAGFRVGDIVKLQRKNIHGWHIDINDQKTNKHTRRKLSGELKERLVEYVKDMKPDDYLFPSREKKGKGKTKKRHQHISTNTVYKIVKKAAEDLGIENIATHSFRKTFGRDVYEQEKDIVIVMEMLNHSSQAICLRYIGKKQDSHDKVMKKFKGY